MRHEAACSVHRPADRSDDRSAAPRRGRSVMIDKREFIFWLGTLVWLIAVTVALSMK
jgi:hypothetical protein